jgi:hypothetical protein
MASWPVSRRMRLRVREDKPMTDGIRRLPISIEDSLRLRAAVQDRTRQLGLHLDRSDCRGSLHRGSGQRCPRGHSHRPIIRGKHAGWCIIPRMGRSTSSGRSRRSRTSLRSGMRSVAARAGLRRPGVLLPKLPSGSRGSAGNSLGCCVKQRGALRNTHSTWGAASRRVRDEAFKCAEEARRVEQVEGEPPCSKLITAEETELPRSRSTAIQSERTRRRSPRALTSPASWIAPDKQQQFLGQGGLTSVRGARWSQMCAGGESLPSGYSSIGFGCCEESAVAASGPLCVGTGAGYDARVASCQLLKSKSASR